MRNVSEKFAKILKLNKNESAKKTVPSPSLTLARPNRSRQMNMKSRPPKSLRARDCEGADWQRLRECLKTSKA